MKILRKNSKNFIFKTTDNFSLIYKLRSLNLDFFFQFQLHRYSLRPKDRNEEEKYSMK